MSAYEPGNLRDIARRAGVEHKLPPREEHAAGFKERYNQSRRLIEQARDAIKTFLFYFDDGTGKHRALVKARETLAALNEWLEVK